jgi:tripartite-type tricarboxylate transporter receptor subunit TctC
MLDNQRVIKMEPCIMKRSRSTSVLFLKSFFCAFLIGPVIVNDAFSQAQYYEGKTIKAIVGQAPGGLGGNRVKAVVPFLQKYIPGKPHIVTEYMDGAGGQKAANYVHKTARPDGLTIGFWSAGTVPAAVLGQVGVLYDLNEVIFLGAHQTGRTTVFFTRKELGLDSLDKLRSASGVRVGAQAVGHGGYYVARLFAFVFGLREPKWVTGYSGPESDVAISTGEIDSRASAVDQILASRADWVDKGLMNFHAIYEVPKGQKHPHPRFAQLPEFSTFAKSDRERKVLDLYRATQSASHPVVLPPKTPRETVQILREAVAKTFEDPQFLKEYEKLTGEEPRPVKGEVLEKEIKDIAGQRDIAELLKRIGGADALPARQ